MRSWITAVNREGDVMARSEGDYQYDPGGGLPGDYGGAGYPLPGTGYDGYDGICKDPPRVQCVLPPRSTWRHAVG